jgi:hypothetical protein
MNPLLPPAPNLFHQHGLALARALAYVREQWDTLRDIVPDDLNDSVHERDVTGEFAALTAELDSYVASVLSQECFADASYDAAIVTAQTTANYVPVEDLSAIVELRRKAWNRLPSTEVA